MATFDLGRVTPLYKGDYNASASYELNDVVLYNGNLYWHVQATATVGILPTDTTVWKLAFADEGVRAEIRGYADDAQASADNALASKSAAATSASNASASASQAALSAQSAQTAETGAIASAQTASTKASEASTSAQSAATSAQTATDKATLATNKAQAASESATLATAKASAAATSETNAAASAQTATTKASEAAASATSAQEYDESAQASAVNAQTAQGLAEQAQTGAETAQGLAEDARDEAQEIVDGINAKASQIDQNTASIVTLEEDCYKPYATDMASGTVASFSDGADDIPLKSLVVNIDPVQDLHGQDAPYPAGGGKNKLLFSDENRTGTSYGVTCTFDRATETFTVTGTETRGSAFSLLTNSDLADLHTPNFVVGETYTVSIVPTGGSNNNYVYCQITYRTTSAKNTALFMTWNKNTFTVPSNFDCVYNVFIGIYAGATDLNYSFKVQIESGSTATSWSPYENICPISGWTGAKVTRYGKNYIQDSDTSYSLTASMMAKYTPVASLADITSGTFSVEAVVPSGQTLKLFGYDGTDNNFIWDLTPQGNGRYAVTSNGNTIKRAKEFRIYSQPYTGGDSVVTVISKAMLVVNDTETEYEPYSGQTLPIDWQTEAGTVYGGKLDVLSGVLTVDRAMVTLDGSSDETFNVTPSGSFTQVGWSGYISIGKPLGSFVSDTFVFSNSVAGLGYIWSSSASRCFMGFPTDVTDVATARQWLSEHPTTIIYELATPQTYQLTPHEVRSLFSTNNIFADTGDCAVEYRADTKMYIERLTEPDADMIADANIVSGQYFLVGNSLYLATSNIASGGQVIVGTNCTQKSLSEALNEINQ